MEEPDTRSSIEVMNHEHDARADEEPDARSSIEVMRHEHDARADGILYPQKKPSK